MKIGRWVLGGALLATGDATFDAAANTNALFFLSEPLSQAGFAGVEVYSPNGTHQIGYGVKG